MATIENPTDPIPPNRWEQSEPHERGYGRKFRQLVEQGQDIHGEARLADALIARGCLVLDAGSGMGRVGARLRELGHEVTAVEKDPELVAMSRELYPDLPVIEQDLLAISPAQLLAHGRPTAYDLVVLVGNVMILLAPDTERRALSTVAAVLRPGGRLLVGFHPAGGDRRTDGTIRLQSSRPTRRRAAWSSSISWADTPLSRSTRITQCGCCASQRLATRVLRARR